MNLASTRVPLEKFTVLPRAPSTGRTKLAFTRRSESPSSYVISYVPSAFTRATLPGYHFDLPLYRASTLSPRDSRDEPASESSSEVAPERRAFFFFFEPPTGRTKLAFTRRSESPSSYVISYVPSAFTRAILPHTTSTCPCTEPLPYRHVTAAKNRRPS